MNWWVPAVLLLHLSSSPSARTLNAILAKVNDNVITLQDYRARKSEQVQTIYAQFTGEELDQRLAEIESNTLDRMIDELLLVQRARDLGIDQERVITNYLEQIQEENQIGSQEEFLALLATEGMDLPTLKESIRRSVVPQLVLTREVRRQVQVTQAAIERYYQAHPEEFVQPPSVVLRGIIIHAANQESREKAEKALQLLEEGNAFEGVAGQYSEAPSSDQGGLLGTYQKDDLSEALREIAFELPVGAISPIITTASTYYILRVEERHEFVQKALETVSDTIREKLHDEMFQEKLEGYLQQLRKDNYVEIVRRPH